MTRFSTKETMRTFGKTRNLEGMFASRSRLGNPCRRGIGGAVPTQIFQTPFNQGLLDDLGKDTVSSLHPDLKLFETRSSPKGSGLCQCSLPLHLTGFPDNLACSGMFGRGSNLYQFR